MHIKLKDLIKERAAPFVNNANPSHMIDLTKPKEEDKLAKGEWDTNGPPGSFHESAEDIKESIPGRAVDHSVDLTSQRQVGKYHYVNYSSSSRRDMTGQMTDPFVGHGAGNEFYATLAPWGSGGGA